MQWSPIGSDADCLVPTSHNHGPQALPVREYILILSNLRQRHNGYEISKCLFARKVYNGKAIKVDIFGISDQHVQGVRRARRIPSKIVTGVRQGESGAGERLEQRDMNIFPVVLELLG